MKKIVSLVISLALVLSCMLPAAMAEGKKINVVTTIFPIYDWAREVAGENDHVQMTLLLDSGVDLHSYQPTAADIMKIANCDVFIYVGGESDEWVEDALQEAVNPNMIVINLVEAMGEDIKMEEIVEGMEHEHEHEESDAHSHEVSTFEDDQVEDRPLSNWAGEWQSAYPYALDGSLDEGFAHKAESGKMTAEEYKQYYITGYETDIDKIVIDGDTNVITYTDVNGSSCQSEYKALGYYIQNWSTGTKAAMYRFEAVDKESGAPIFIEFNDHIIENVKAEHFHLRASNESFDAIEDPENKWPTFYPADFDADEMLAAFVGHDHEHEHGEKEEEADEHVWLSLRNAEKLVKVIADAMAEIDTASAEAYQANAAVYMEKLAALDAEYTKVVGASTYKTMLFGDRFPFRYLVDDYDLSYYAAFSGCSAESEASFQTILFLAQKVDELNLPAVLTIERSSTRIAQTVVSTSQNKEAKILAMDSMQSTTSSDVKAGVTYLSVMESNLQILKEALN